MLLRSPSNNRYKGIGETWGGIKKWEYKCYVTKPTISQRDRCVGSKSRCKTVGSGEQLIDWSMPDAITKRGVHIVERRERP